MSKNLTYSSDLDLIPLANPKSVGLPFSRRVLGRRIVAGSFPEIVRINNRLFITRQALETYKKQLACAPSVQPFEQASQVTL
jgi:hypothetical protein